MPVLVHPAGDLGAPFRPAGFSGYGSADEEERYGIAVPSEARRVDSDQQHLPLSEEPIPLQDYL